VPVNDWWSLVAGSVVGIAVCLPFFPGWLFLLDSVPGSHSPIIPAFFWGTGNGITSGVLFAIVSSSLVHLLGAVGSWLPILLVFPIGTLTMGRLVDGGLLRRLTAGLFYVANPFVFDRVFAGDVPFLLGYALLPAAVASAHRLATRRGTPWSLALWVAALVALSPHFAWIVVVPVLALLATGWRQLRAWLAALAAAAAALAMSLYVVVPPIASGTKAVGLANQLAAYRTTGDARVGLYVNILGLYGFWRSGPVEPKSIFSGWPAILLAILLITGLGIQAAIRDRAVRRLSAALLVAAVVGYFLALGPQGPTAAAYRYALVHIPGFVVMRESEKFSALLALAIAFGFGWGSEQLVDLFHRHTWAPVLITVLLPFGYTPNLLGGLGGQVTASQYPQDWGRAAQLIDRGGGGTVVIFPWNLYLSDPLTSGRVTAEPGRGVFGSAVMSSDPGVGYDFSGQSRSDQAVQYLTTHGFETTHAGALLGQLGVRWIVLEKAEGFTSYSWLARQSDITRVLDGPTIEVWRVLENGLAPRFDTHLVAVRDELGLVEHAAVLAKQAPMVSAAAGASPTGLEDPSTIPTGSGVATRESPVAWRVAAGHRGYIVLPIPYAKGWVLGDHDGFALPTGNLAVYSTGVGGQLRYRPWGAIVTSYWLSLAAVALTLVLYGLTRRARARSAHGRSARRARRARRPGQRRSLGVDEDTSGRVTGGSTAIATAADAGLETEVRPG
jgi:hypothetical protein